MEMHQLRYFVSVARLGNFSRAAEQCHVAQPSLSQQILKLEEEMGERLFERLRRQTVLTPAGELFLPRALRVLDEVEAAKREAHDARGVVRGAIRLGVLPTIAPYLLPRIIPVFLKRYPDVELKVIEETSARLERLLQTSEIDVAIASLPLEQKGLSTQKLHEEELLLALPPTHPLATKRQIDWKDLAVEKWIVMQEGHCLGDQVLRFCHQRDQQARVGFRSAQLETVQAMVQSGLGISLIPAMAARKSDSPKYRPLRNPRPTRTLVAVWPAQRPPARAAREFLQLLTQQLSPS